MLILGVDILVEVRVGMRLFFEFVAVISLEVGVQEADVPAVHLDALVYFANGCIVEVY